MIKRWFVIMLISIASLVGMDAYSAAADNLGMMSSIRNISGVYPFRNGYGCAIDNEFVMYYFDCNGQIVFKNDYGYIVQQVWPIDSGVTITRDKNTKNFRLTDMDNEVLREFPSTEYTWIGVPSNGLIGAEKMISSLSGSTKTVVYFDSKGKEILNFPGMEHLTNGLSNFSGDRAFLKNISGEFVLIDNQGNQKIVCIENSDKIIKAAERDFREWTNDDGYSINRIEIKKAKVDSVNSFEEGEEYASATIEAEVVIYYQGRYHEEDSWYRSDFVGAIDRNGNLKLLGAVDGVNAPSVPPCKNGAILVKAEESSGKVRSYDGWYNVSTGELINAKDIAEISMGINHRITFMESGNILVTMNNADNSASFYAVVDRNGNVVEGPDLEYAGLWNGAVMTDPYFVDCNHDTRVILKIMNDDLIKNNSLRSSREKEYLNVNGERIGNETYVLNTDFQNGYAIVTHGSSKVSYAISVDNLGFINTKCEPVNSVVVP